VGEVAQAIVALDAASARSATRQALDAGIDAMSLLEDARLGLQEVGDRFDRGEYYLVELVRASQVFQEVAQLLNPELQARYGNATTRGKVLLGTVAGDIHDLGKSIVKVLLECRGVEVMDLGVDVPAERFIEAVRAFQPQVVGMSALLTAAIPQFRSTLDAMAAAGVRDSVRVIVGGGTVADLHESEVAADHVASDASEGVEKMLTWLDSVPPTAR
jgi:methanogenic corrinoid protein MtbC1